MTVLHRGAFCNTFNLHKAAICHLGFCFVYFLVTVYRGFTASSRELLVKLELNVFNCVVINTVLRSSAVEERAGCSTLNVFLLSCVYVLMSLPYGAMAVADPEGVHLSPPPPPPPIFKYPMKMK